MTLKDLLQKNKTAIAEKWLDRTLETYASRTAVFFKQTKDPFANPVGAGLREGLAELLDGLIRGVEPESLSSALDRVIRVRAVQDFAPSAAVSFVFDLKDLVREALGVTNADGEKSMDMIGNRIERLGLIAFDVYMGCREQMWAIRAQEIRNQSVGIMERVAAWRERREENSETHR